jgi:hypothetical protein
MIPYFAHATRTGGTSIRKGWGSVAREGEFTKHEYDPPTGAWIYTWVRHPVDRALSFWRFTEDAEGGTFEDWVLSGRIFRIKTLVGIPLMSQMSDVWAKSAAWVGRFEQRSDDLPALARILGRPVPTDHVYPTHSIGIVTDNARAALEKIYADDFHCFGYQ